MNGYIRAENKRVDWNVFDQIRITYTYEGNLSLSHMYTKRRRLYVHLILLFLSSFFFLELLRNVQIYQENDDSFDAITIDPQRDQIIIGAK